MSAISLEQRVAALEFELQALKRRMHPLSSRKPNPNWLDEVAGSMKDFPEWDDVMQICREMREAELAEFDKAAANGGSTANGDNSCSSSTPAS